jgi:cytidine deaminase
LKPNITKLIREAKKASTFSQAKYSNFPVGVALFSNNGEVILGCNVESSSFGLSICAERVALTKALSEGIVDFHSIIIYASNAEYCPPCGACRQLLYDYCPNITVILTNGKEYNSFKLKELLPYAFEESKLKR